MKMFSGLSKVFAEGKTKWNTITNEFEEISEISNKYLLEFIPKRFLEKEQPWFLNKSLIKNIALIFSEIHETYEFEDRTSQTLVKENKLKLKEIRIITISEAISKLDTFTLKVKEEISEINRQDDKRLQDLSEYSLDE